MEWAGRRKIRAKAVRHLPAECGNYRPFTQRDDRCTYSCRVWDLSASLVKINPGGHWLEGGHLVVMRPSWKAGVSNACAGLWLDRRASNGLWFLTWKIWISPRRQVSHTRECRASTSPFCFLTSLDTYTRELVCMFCLLTSSLKYNKSSGGMSVIKAV